MQIVVKLIHNLTSRKKYLSALFVLLKVIFFILLCNGIYTQLKRYSSSEWYTYLSSIELSSLLLGFSGLLVLMGANWGLEAMKWHILINKLEDHSFSRSLKAILSSVAIGFNTPNRIGEFSGKLLFVKKKNLFKAIGLSLVSSFAQIIVTLSIGFLALLNYLKLNPVNIAPINATIISVCVGTFIVFGFIVYLLWKYHIGLKTKLRMRRLSRIIVGLKPGIYVNILLLSLFRYLIYVFQFVLLLKFFGIDVAYWIKGVTISTMYLFQTISPSISLIDLGIRQNLAYFLFNPFSDNMIGITLATFSIWMLNLAIPAIIGYGVILKTKLFDDEI